MGLGTWALAGGLVLAAVVVCGRAVTAVASPSRPIDGLPAPARDDGSLYELLRSLPIDVLCDEWWRTARSTGSSDDDSAAGARLRELLIAELH